MKAKIQTSFRLSEEAVAMLTALGSYWGLNNTATLEKVLRDVARKEVPPATLEWARNQRKPVPPDFGKE